MVFIGGGLGIILHLAWLACLFFIMDEQSVPVHSVPVSDTVHLHLPVPELSDMATTVQSTGALVQDHDSDVPQRAQCIVKRFQKRSSTHPTPPLERSASPPSVDAFQQAVDTFISGTESVSLELPGSESPSLPQSRRVPVRVRAIRWSNILMCIRNSGHVPYIFGVNSVSSLLLARAFCRTFCIVTIVTHYWSNFCDAFPITLLFVTLRSCGSCSRL